MTWLTHPSAHVAAPLKTITNAHPAMHTHIEHSIDLPILCHRSMNPLAGSQLLIRYQAGERILELFALDAYIKAYVGHTIVRDMEMFVQVIAQECADVLGTTIEGVGLIRYNGLSMGQTITVQALPKSTNSI